MAHHQLSPTWVPPLVNLLPLTLVALPLRFLTIFGDMSNLKSKVQFFVKFLAFEVDLFLFCFILFYELDQREILVD